MTPDYNRKYPYYIFDFISFARVKRDSSVEKPIEGASIELIELSSSDENESSKQKERIISVNENIIESTSTSDEERVHRNFVISEELKKIKDIPPNLALVQTFYERKWFGKDTYVEYPVDKWMFRKHSGKENLRSATFRHLWNEGFYLTAGDKFGADFLAYPGIRIVYLRLLMKYFERGFPCR